MPLALPTQFFEYPAAAAPAKSAFWPGSAQARPPLARHGAC